MNPAFLLAHFERLAEAHDAIPRLRQFILDLAVRGKLVEQNASDEPASELLERIAAERARQVQAGKIKELKPTAPIGDSEVPIEVPNRWAWIRLRELGSLGGGMTPSMSRAEFWGGDVLWVSPKDMRADELVSSELKITEEALKQTRLQVYPPGSLFMVVRSGILKRRFPVAVNRLPAAANQDMKVLVPFICEQDRYLQIMFRGLTDFILKNLVKTGTTVQSIKYAEFEEQPFPLPPLAEQHRIVVKVDELMALCDRLEAARNERESRRDRLVAASLHRLSQPAEEDGADAFRAKARFYFNHLPRLTTRPAHIKQLRQAILNLAVCGRLVPQDPNEVTDQAVTPSLRSSGRQVPEDESLLDLPAGWRWVHFADVATFENGDRSKRYPTRTDYVDHGVPWINTGHIMPDGSLSLETMNYITQAKFDELGGGKIRPGDMLYCLRGATFGKTAFVEPFDIGAIASSLMIIRPSNQIDRRYTYFYLISPFGREQLKRFDNGTAQPNLSSASVKQYLVPLPPLAEQHRIVAKVDELMAICDRLEASLAETEADSHRLLEAVLHEALQPAEDALEAAD